MGYLRSFSVACWLSLLTALCTTANFCGPAEEGKQLNISCRNRSPAFSRNFYHLSWNADDFYYTVASCIERGSNCSTTYPAYFIATISGSSSTLTIQDVSRSDPFNMETQWSCHFISERLDDQYSDTACSSLEVYAKPGKPVCELPVLNVTTFETEVTCSTGNVYPQALCALYLGLDTDSVGEVNTTTITYSHYELNKPLVYYRSECTMVVPLSTIESYGNYFYVKMYPNVTGGSQFGVVSDTSRIVLAKPEKPTCGSPVLNTSTFDIVVTCSTERVNPQALCALYVGKNNDDFNQVYVSSATYSHDEVNETVVYYKSECTLTVSLGNLISYGNYFKVQMFPDAPGGSKYGVDSDAVRINLAIVPEETNQTVSENTAASSDSNDDSVPAIPIMITLGVLLALTLCVAIILAVVVCRSRRTTDEPLTALEISKPIPEPDARRYHAMPSSQRDKAEGHSHEGADDYEMATSQDNVYANQQGQNNEGYSDQVGDDYELSSLDNVYVNQQGQHSGSDTDGVYETVRD